MSTEDELRRTVAMACRVVGVEFGMGAGHVSARVPGSDEMWLLCRGGNGRGLAGANLNQIRRLDFDGGGPGLGTKYWPPNETPLHGEIYKVRPDVGAVVHVHPEYAMLCSVIGVEFTPIFGGYSPALARIAITGVPTYPRAATVTDKDMAREMVQVLGNADLVLLRGHGIAATGRTVEAATSLALRFEKLCQIMWKVASSGHKPFELSQADKDRYDPRNPARRAGLEMLNRYGDRVTERRGGDDDGEEIGARGWAERLRSTVGLPDEGLDDEG